MSLLGRTDRYGPKLATNRAPPRLRAWEEGVFALPNVRAEAGPTAGRQGPVGENVPRTADRALVACRWASPRARG